MVDWFSDLSGLTGHVNGYSEAGVWHASLTQLGDIALVSLAKSAQKATSTSAAKP
jgi:hypothetical protein